MSPTEMNKNKKVDNWEIWQYCHNLTTKNPNFASCRGNSTKLVLFAHLLVLHFSLILSFVFFFFKQGEYTYLISSFKEPFGMQYLQSQSYENIWTKHILIYRNYIVICEKKITFLQSLLLSVCLAPQCISLLRGLEFCETPI